MIRICIPMKYVREDLVFAKSVSVVASSAEFWTNAFHIFILQESNHFDEELKATESHNKTHLS